MARRAPTAEQKQKAAERRERFRALCRDVAALTDDQRAALVNRAGAILTCEGRALSTHNSCLIISQLQTASVVGGFWQWQKAGRRVRKGSTGLSLWIPTTTKAGAEVDLNSGELLESDGTKSKRGGKFIVGTVFDISQTDPMDEPEAVAVEAGYRIEGEDYGGAFDGVTVTSDADSGL